MLLKIVSVYFWTGFLHTCFFFSFFLAEFHTCFNRFNIFIMSQISWVICIWWFCLCWFVLIFLDLKLFLLPFLWDLKIPLPNHSICWWHFPLNSLFEFHFKFISVWCFFSNFISLINPTFIYWIIFIVSSNCLYFHGTYLEHLFPTSLGSLNLFLLFEVLASI